jgi:hypothetical protein
MERRAEDEGLGVKGGRSSETSSGIGKAWAPSPGSMLHP